eukprot:gene1745-3372_t
MFAPNFFRLLLGIIYIRNTQSYRNRNRTRGRQNYDTLSLNPQGRSLSNNKMGAVVYLVSSKWRESRQDRKCNFNKSMDALYQYWHPNNPYPIILMNTQSWLKADMKIIRRKYFKMDILFIDISKYFYINPGITSFEDAAAPLSDINYKHMSNFFFHGFLKIPLLQQFKYIFRLDDDTCIQDPINYDIFHEMYTYGLVYSYHTTWNDADNVVKGLSQFVDDYITHNNIQIANIELYNFVKKSNQIPAFSTNLEIIDTHKYKRKEILKFIDAVVSSNYIYHRRWGDAPLRFVLAELFWRPNEVLRLCEFDYQHSSWAVSSMCDHRTHLNAVWASVAA